MTLKAIIKRHYGMKRAPTLRECFAEVYNIKRKAERGTLDDHDRLLYADLIMHGKIN